MLDRLFTFLMAFSTLVLKPSFSQSLSLHSHLSFAQAHLMELDHSMFGSHWRRKHWWVQQIGFWAQFIYHVTKWPSLNERSFKRILWEILMQSHFSISHLHLLKFNASLENCVTNENCVCRLFARHAQCSLDKILYWQSLLVIWEVLSLTCFLNNITDDIIAFMFRLLS